MQTRVVTLLLVVALVLPALAIAPLAAAQQQTYFPATEWRTSTPEEQGIDSARLLAALDYAAAQKLPMDSLTVIRHGYVVLDAYYHPYTAEMQHHIWAATEGVVGMLAGIAIDQGLIAGLDQPLLALFPDRTIANRSAGKEALTIGHLLTMSSGITCGPWDALMKSLLESPDTLGTLLDLRINSAPGSTFSLCPLGADILAGAVQTSAGMPLRDFADRYLFAPLGISNYRWQTYPDSSPAGEFGLYLTPHDMARLGYLYLQGGQWAGQQVVSPDWVATATCADPSTCPFYEHMEVYGTELGGPVGYGYNWWIFQPSTYVTGIFGVDSGQVIVVAPEQDMVVVATSRSNEDPADVPMALIYNQIVKTAGMDGPLPANPEALAALQARVDALANPQPLAVELLPQKAAQISGITYDLAPPAQLWVPSPALGDFTYGGSTQINAFALTFDQPDEAVLELEFGDGYRAPLAVGLDGVNRVTDTARGPIGITGRWAPSGQGFSMTLQFVGSGEEWQISYGGLGNRVLFICQNVSATTTQPPSNATPRGQ